MKVSDEKIIAALMTSATNAEAAKSAGLSLTQLYNRMRNPDFKTKLAEARARLMDGATAALQARMGEAVDTMTEIMPRPRRARADAIKRGRGGSTQQLEAVGAERHSGPSGRAGRGRA